MDSSFSDDLLALFCHLFGCQLVLLVGSAAGLIDVSPCSELAQPVLQDHVPVFGCHDLLEAVLNDVWTFRDGIEDHVASEPDTDLLKDERSLSDHQNRSLLHLVQGSKSLALPLLRVLTDHGHVLVLVPDVVPQSDVIEVRGNEHDRIPRALLIDVLPERLHEELEPCLIFMFKGGNRRYSLQGHAQLELFRDRQGSVGVQFGHVYSPEYI